MKCVVFLSLLGLCCFHQASGVVHSHHYMYTATTGMSGFPEFVIVGAVDGQQINYYDSNIKEMIPRHEWVRGAVDADFWKRNGQNALGTQSTFAVNLVTLKERFNQTGGVHTIQMMYGCTLDSEGEGRGEKVDGFLQYGYDGEDFFSYNSKDMACIAPVPQAVPTKHKWEKDSGRLEYWKTYLGQECTEWLEKYITYGRKTFERTVPPEVSVFQKDSSSVVCHASGFYPEGVMITWKRDGVEIHEDMNVGETVPNEDGTFQKRVVLTVSPEEWKKSQYICDVAHKSGSVSKSFNPDERNLDDPGTAPIGLIIGVIVGILLIGCFAGFLWWRKRNSNSGFVPANTKDDVSASSDETPGKV